MDIFAHDYNTVVLAHPPVHDIGDHINELAFSNRSRKRFLLLDPEVLHLKEIAANTKIAEVGGWPQLRTNAWRPLRLPFNQLLRYLIHERDTLLTKVC